MKIITFWQMPRKQKALFFMNIMLCGIAKGCIHLFAYKRLAPYFGKPYRMMAASIIATPTQIQKARYIGDAIRLAARYTPWDSSCLTQAMVAKFWCQYYEIPYFLYIGFAKKSDKPLGEEAHAWVTSGPVAITGGQAFNTHQVIYSYSNYYTARGHKVKF